MNISMIAAVDSNMGIGKDGQLPWYLPADLQHFKDLTIGKPVVMGRRTFESLNRTLPDRKNIVMTHGMKSLYHDYDYEIAGSWQEALDIAGDVQEVMVMGGASIYELFMPRATRLYITSVVNITNNTGGFNCDTYFPEIRHQDWRLTFTDGYQADLYNQFSYKFLTFQRTINPLY